MPRETPQSARNVTTAIVMVSFNDIISNYYTLLAQHLSLLYLGPTLNRIPSDKTLPGDGDFFFFELTKDSLKSVFQWWRFDPDNHLKLCSKCVASVLQVWCKCVASVLQVRCTVCNTRVWQCVAVCCSVLQVCCKCVASALLCVQYTPLHVTVTAFVLYMPNTMP